MINPRKMWDMSSSYLRRKKEISHKTTYQSKIHLENVMNKMMKSINHILEIMTMVVFIS